jgi:hypothetical protein
MRREISLDSLGHSQAVHQRLDALAAEYAQQVILKRKEEAGGARVALAAGATAELVVDAPSFMALGAEDVQAPEGDHFIVLRAALLHELVVDGFPLFRGNLKNLAFLLEQHHVGRRAALGAVSANHGGRRSVGNRELFVEAFLAGHRFRVSAQQDVGAAAGHVG